MEKIKSLKRRKRKLEAEERRRAKELLKRQRRREKKIADVFTILAKKFDKKIRQDEINSDGEIVISMSSDEFDVMFDGKFGEFASAGIASEVEERLEAKYGPLGWKEVWIGSHRKSGGGLGTYGEFHGVILGSGEIKSRRASSAWGLV